MKNKEKLKENLIEAVLEIVIALVLFGIGVGIVYLFGGELDAPELDFELIVLIGIGAVTAVGVLIFIAVKLFRKYFIKKESINPEEGEDHEHRS